MLYDPKWEVRKASPSDFIAWLETMEPEATYDFDDCEGMCLVGQYMKACGTEWGTYDLFYRKFCTMLGGTGDWWNIPVILTEPHTFGAALKRARELLVTD